MDRPELVTMRGISKRFGGVQALAGVDFSVRAGEVHALLGENGAGKSTLIRILTGAYPPDEGSMLLNGRPYSPRSPRDALRLGVGAIHQELHLIPTLSVAENLLLGRLPRRFGCIDWREARVRAKTTLLRLGLDIDVTLRLDACSVAVRQMVAIARALHDTMESGDASVAGSARLLVMDEPTSSLDRSEARRFLELIRGLKISGMGIVFISHSLDEVYAVSDRMTVLRDGGNVGVFRTEGMPRRNLVAHMLGRLLSRQDRVERNVGSERDVHASPPSPPVLECRELSRRHALESASFELHRGEVLGLAGLLGSGRTETARLVFGADKPDGGTILIDHQPVTHHHPAESVRRGMGFCPEDRALEGVIGELSVRENIALVAQRQLSRWGVVSRVRQHRLAEEMIRRLGIAASGPEQPVHQLSGGNQQKVVLARWLATKPKLLILDEPTRGIDIGAKEAVETLVRELSAQGMALIFISGELDEILRASDRILVLHDRRVVGEVLRTHADAEGLMNLMAGSGGVSPAGAGGRADGPWSHPVNERLDIKAPVTANEPGAASIPLAKEAGPAPQTRPSVRRTQTGRTHRRGALPSWTWPLLALCGIVILSLICVPRFGHLEFNNGRLEGAAVQILRQAAPVAILAVGMTLVIALGGIDLSVGTVMAMAGAAGALVLTRGGSAAAAVGAGLAMGMLSGAWNGALVALARLPAMIATLILLVAGRGLAQLPTEGLLLTFEAPAFEWLASGRLLGLPFPIFLAIGVAWLAWVITRFSVVGLYLESCGAGRAASYLCGLRIRTLEAATYVASGTCAGLAGLLVAADTKAADVSTCGLYLELDAILAVVIGGTRLKGGRIRLGGAVLGALLMQTLTTAMLMSNIAPPHALVVKGLAALAVCLLSR